MDKRLLLCLRARRKHSSEIADLIEEGVTAIVETTMDFELRGGTLSGDK